MDVQAFLLAARCVSRARRNRLPRWKRLIVADKRAGLVRVLRPADEKIADIRRDFRCSAWIISSTTYRWRETGLPFSDEVNSALLIHQAGNGFSSRFHPDIQLGNGNCPAF